MDKDVIKKLLDDMGKHLSDKDSEDTAVLIIKKMKDAVSISGRVSDLDFVDMFFRMAEGIANHFGVSKTTILSGAIAFDKAFDKVGSILSRNHAISLWIRGIKEADKINGSDSRS